MNQLFKSFKTSKEGQEKITKVKTAFDDLLIFISKYCEESREFSICKSKLEESCFYAVKSVSISNQESENK